MLPWIFLIEALLVYFSKYVVVGSDSDKNRLKQLYGNKNKFYTIGIRIERNINLSQTEIINQYSIPLKKIKLLFFGSFSYGPNLEALRYLESQIIPNLTDDCILFICGKDLPIPLLFDKNKIRYLGFVEDIDSFISISDYILAPIFS